MTFLSPSAGHSNVSTTLDVYAQLWAKQRHEQDAVAAMEAALLGKEWESSGGERRRTDVLDEGANVGFLGDSASGGLW